MLSEPKHILVVEDAEDIRVLLSGFLQVSGYTVDCAEDGQDALRILQGMTTLPDLILLDLMMPDMDGFEFRHAQMSDPRLAAIPILVMSADSHIRTKIVGMGAAGFLKKPFVDLDLILNTVAASFEPQPGQGLYSFGKSVQHPPHTLRH
jgi:CheY-like chemotaxis protein